MKQKKTILSSARAALLLVALLLTTATAWAETTENLGGYNFTVETDTEGSYYVIDCADALFALAAYVNADGQNTCSGKRFKQTADIDMNGKSFTPIGEDDCLRMFEGTYDGDGYFILNITHTAAYQYGISGLFGDFRGTVKNVKLKILKGYDV